jgi:hypothetical protein
MNATRARPCRTCRAPIPSHRGSCRRCGIVSGRVVELQVEQARRDAERWANDGGSVDTGLPSLRREAIAMQFEIQDASR